MFNHTDCTLGDALAQRLHLRQVVISIRDKQMPPARFRLGDELPGLGGIERHRLFTQHMRAGVECCGRVFAVKVMGRGYDNDIRLSRKYFFVMLRGEYKAEMAPD